MKTFGFPAAIKALEGWAREETLRLQAAAQEVVEHLADWARDEHPWQNQRGDTEASIKGVVVQATPLLVLCRLQASWDAALWLELKPEGEGGKWSWLWNVIWNHRDEVLAILAKGGITRAVIERNPDVVGQYEAAKAAMKR